VPLPSARLGAGPRPKRHDVCVYANVATAQVEDLTLPSTRFNERPEERPSVGPAYATDRIYLPVRQDVGAIRLLLQTLRALLGRDPRSFDRTAFWRPVQWA
jgi:hypothetical protein